MECPKCSGSGLMDCEECGTPESVTCDNCDGEGEVEDEGE